MRDVLRPLETAPQMVLSSGSRRPSRINRHYVFRGIRSRPAEKYQKQGMRMIKRADSYSYDNCWKEQEETLQKCAEQWEKEWEWEE